MNLARRGLGAGLEDVREPLAQPRVGAVGGDDQAIARPQQLVGVGFGGEANVDADIDGASLEKGEQHPALHGRHPVAVAQVPLAAQPHFDRVPVHAVLGERGTQDRIGLVDALERGVREDDAEAEGVLGAVALEDGHLSLGVCGLRQRRREEPARTTTQYRYPHSMPLVVQYMSFLRRSTS